MSEISYEAYKKIKHLRVVLVLTSILFIVQMIGSYMSDSLTVLSSAIHSLSDFIVIVVSYFATKMANNKKFSKDYTYGYKRAEMLAALMNGIIITLVAFEILKHAIERLGDEGHVEGDTLIWVAIISIVIKSVSIFVLKSHIHDSLNVKAVVIHLAGDVVTFITVLISGVLIMVLKVDWIDAVISIIISIGLLYFSLKLLRDALYVFMQFTPKGVDLEQIKMDLESINHVKLVFHMHAWKLNDTDIHFQGNVAIDKELVIEEIEDIIQQSKNILLAKYGINHSILEPELYREEK